MISIDLDKLVALHSNLYTSATRSAFGEDGLEALQQLINGIVKIYRRIDPSLRAHELVLFADVSNTQFMGLGSPRRVHSIVNLADELDGACIACINADYSLDVYSFDATKLAELSQGAVVYYHHGKSEKIVIRSEDFRLINPISGFGSIFCKPSFSSLATALDSYRTKQAAHTSCEILKSAWNEPSRWFLKHKPERIMRKSLVQYLNNVLSDAEVRPEQNVDESHPVDVKVSFALTDQRAIIEIKWLGASVDDTGKMTTSYTQARAVDGAKQLAEYLDSSCEWGANVMTRGYLVVFDARRKGLTQGITTLSLDHALHFKDENITYSPDYSLTRKDFEVPVRMYMFPKTA